jgi:HSP20 family protein
MTSVFDLMPTVGVGYRPRSLFDRFFEGWTHPHLYVEASEGWMPASDIAETEKEYVVSAEMPGIDMKGMDISFSNGVLTIKGEKKKESSEGECCHCAERCAGPFERSFRISGKVDSDKIDATYKAGILKVVIPKSEESVPKKIEVH